MDYRCQVEEAGRLIQFEFKFDVYVLLLTLMSDFGYFNLDAEIMAELIGFTTILRFERANKLDTRIEFNDQFWLSPMGHLSRSHPPLEPLGQVGRTLGKSAPMRIMMCLS